MKKIITIGIIAATLSACATPTTMMKNPQTGQIATCGGNISSSMVGGLIGYHIQKSNDDDCVTAYSSQGFTKI